jgi:hypothetical protein
MELKRGRRLKGASSCLEDQRTSHRRYCELDGINDIGLITQFRFKNVHARRKN